MMARGLIIGAPRSGSGKTTLTLAILAAARQRGIAVRAAKSGPDYIDTAFHAAATSLPSYNLESWAMAPAQLSTVAGWASQNASITIIESSMGLFDGVAGLPGRTGAGADIAACLNLPVVLVLDVSGHSQTAAAVARGFVGHAPGVHIAGVIVNRLASSRHREGIEAAMSAIDMPVLGWVPRDEEITVPERHLGLVQALEHPDLRRHLDRLAALAEAYLDIEGLLDLATSIVPPTGTAPSLLPPPGQRIAMARDEAFSFAYAHLLEGWRQAGASIVCFSPLADQPPPADCDSCWLPGGYPELHAPRLAAATGFMTGLAAFAQTRPVHGECGGYMVLGGSLQTADGAHHRMTGLLSHATSFAQRKMNLGYRQATLLADSPIGKTGTVIRGHEFHYASMTHTGTDTPLANLTDAAGRPLGPSGGRRGHVTGAFFHAIAADPMTAP